MSSDGFIEYALDMFALQGKVHEMFEMDKAVEWDRDTGIGTKLKEQRIITDFVYPPIPTRVFDWCAFRDGNEESGPVGWGETEAAAIKNLLENEDE